ncbi:MAG: hypothetical protein FWG68_07780 [Defluviitaleaceae bacterium]|nr:hypothetical protein [Defluviitaleaceae bacterium]
MKKELTLADVNFLPQERLITEKEIFKEFREHIVLFNCENDTEWMPLGYTGRLLATLYVGRREEMLVDIGYDLIFDYTQELWEKGNGFVSKFYYVFPEDEDNIYS